MESLQAYVLLASTAFHACAAFLFGSLYLERRSPEHRAFALLCLITTLYVGTTFLSLVGSTPEVRLLALRAHWTVGPLGGAVFVEFCWRLAPALGRTTVRIGYVIGVCAALVAAFGPLLDEDAAMESLRAEPLLLPIAAAIAVLIFILIGIAASALVRAARSDREAKVIGTFAVVALGMAIVDEVIRWRRGERIGLSEHAASLLVGAVSLVLLQRFAAIASGLAEQTAVLEAATRQLERTRQEQVRKGQLAALGELSASVAHEVRNPLAIMKNAISGMKRPTLEARDRATLLSIVTEETDRLSRLVRDLLAFARPRREADATTLLRALVDAAVVEARQSARGVGEVAIDVRVPNALAVSGDPELLRLAIANVVENAVHAMPKGGALTIDARTLTGDPPTIEILFRDEGEGMDPVVLGKALDPFFTTRAAGTGLGLAIVDNVVRSHGGDVTIESEPGFGTTVAIRVPLVRPSV
jgi:signal transduction histidine kinase